jgi:hypothetical protein
VTLAPKGLLIEEQRTNLYVRSEEFQTTWGVFDVTVAANTAVAPDGTLTADKLIPNTSNAVHRVSQSGLGAAGAHTQSCYMKAGEYSWGVLRVEGVNSFFNLSNGTLGASGAGNTSTITSVGNGWYRCTVTRTLAAAMGSTIGAASADNTDTFAGNGTDGIFVWGAQLESGSFSTSYIPTVASQVTRAADNASMIGNNFARWYNVNEGTLYGEALTNNTNGSAGIASIEDGTSNNRMQIRANSSSAGALVVVTNNTAVVSMTNGSFPAGSFGKISTALKANDFAISVNSASVTIDNSGALPVVDRMFVGSGSSQSNMNGNIKRIAFYPRRLADSELIGITS